MQSFNSDPAAFEQALMEAVARHPVVASIAITASFQNYYPDMPRSGIYETGIHITYQPEVFVQSQPLTEQNVLGYHAVLIVGYGLDINGVEYWILKNSWGEEWGKGGYMYLARKRGHNIFVSPGAVYPNIEKNQK